MVLRKTRSIAIVTASLTVALSLISCTLGGSSDGGVAGTGVTPSAAAWPIYLKAASPTFKEVKKPQVWWRDSIVAGVTFEEGVIEVQAWSPGAKDFTVCRFKGLQGSEIMPVNVMRGSGVDIGTTEGPTPRTALTYATTTPGQGTYVYVQPINVDTCAVGERVNVSGAPVPPDIWLDPTFYAATGDTLAIKIFDRDSTAPATPGFPSVVGFNVNTKQVTWQHAYPHSGVNFAYVSDGGLTAGAVIVTETNQQSGAETTVSRLLDAQSGNVIAQSAPGAVDTAAELGQPAIALLDGRFIATERKGTTRQQVVIEGTKITAIPGGHFTDSAYFEYGTSGAPIMIGEYVNAAGEKSFGYMDASLKYTQLLAPAAYQDAMASYAGTSAGKVYFWTPSGVLVVGMDGKRDHAAEDLNKAPYVPAGRRMIAGKLLSLWQLHPNDRPGAAAPYAVVPDGEVPQPLTAGA